ncbi:MAG TPA: hypothetical protein VIH57_23175, partial [Bacteroidales bacterium]
KTLYSSERIDLYNMNGYYISKPISLVPGSYKLTKFMVVDKDNNVLYVTPMEGSAKAYLVNDPLPIGFSVQKDQVTKVVPQVISAAGSKPEDFGYATFSFDVVKTFDFLIGVFVYNESVQNFEMTTAHLSIATDSGWVYQKDVPAATDTITVKDGQSKYILTVTKDGYNTWVDTLTASELKKYFAKPLIVILEKGDEKKVWFITNQSTLTPVIVRLFVDPSDSILFINWGDGITERIPKVIPDPWGCNYFISHSYSNESKYKVSISGALDKVGYIRLDSCQLESADIRMLNNLNTLGITSNHYLSKLDLSNLPLLVNVQISWNNINELILTNSNNIKYLEIDGNNLQNIDVSGRTNLYSLNCQSCKISTLNITDCANLHSLYCDFNNISTLDISSCSNLVDFQCTNNNLSQLDVSKNLNLLSLSCGNNKLSSIDISKNIKLKGFQCSFNNFSNLDLSKNTALTGLSCDNNKLTTLNIKDNHFINSLCFCSNNFSSEEIDTILIDLMNNVKNYNIKDGRLNLSPSYATEDRLKLLYETLHFNDYNWLLFLECPE